MTSELKPCPFCLRPLKRSSGKFNPMAVCETDGCWMKEKQIAVPCDDPFSVKSWNTSAVPDVPELVRYSVPDRYDKVMPDGEYVLHSQAAEIIAEEQQKTKDAEELAFRMDRFAQKYLSHMRNAEQRAEAAESKLAQYEAQHEKEMTEVIKERDQCEAWADKLAHAIGGEAIGEHSNMNNPWANALEIASSPAPAEDLKAANERLRAGFRKLMSGYVNTLENGMDRIRSLGGSCDDLDTMINNDPYLRDARAALNVEASNDKG